MRLETTSCQRVRQKDSGDFIKIKAHGYQMKKGEGHFKDPLLDFMALVFGEENDP